jgi:hypothetical protein
MEDMKSLERLDYTSPVEALAEKFHGALKMPLTTPLSP